MYYNIKDGTGVQDYIHVTDLADSYVTALKSMENPLLYIQPWFGKGYSVLDLIHEFEGISNHSVQLCHRSASLLSYCRIFEDPEMVKKNWAGKSSIVCTRCERYVAISDKKV
ncbi:MAG: UDP-glucose 4-epimerase [Candidatus Tokpelaia sp. JSC189]|nr:MAG: UDP-glucose 4-epimerase [Candidatus Tokpelaia sp. JSC189]